MFCKMRFCKKIGVTPCTQARGIKRYSSLQSVSWNDGEKYMSQELLKELPGVWSHQRVVNHDKRCLGMYYSKGSTDIDNIHV